MLKKSICQNWEFCLNDVPENAEPKPTAYVWQCVTLPHDWCTDHPFERDNSTGARGAYVKAGVGWYRKWINFSKEELEKRVIIYFDGIYRRSEIYVNGKKVGERANGYISFWYDIQAYLIEGANLIAIRVDCSEEPSSRWYNGCGMTRPVWLYMGERQSIPPHGIQIVCEDITKQACSVHINVQIDSFYESFLDTQLKLRIIDSKGQEEAVSTIQAKDNNHAVLSVENPRFWDIDNPVQYTCEASVIYDGKVDTMYQKFGVRTVEFIPNKGFFLNGKWMKLKGVCNHHDAGCLGAAVPEAVWKKRLLMLKEMGCNAIRTSHNPFVPFFYDLCDELGMLVMDECFDGWDVPKAKYDYGTDWEENHVQDLKDFIIRDRNHPSIFLWSIGNEVRCMKTDITIELMSIVRELDSSRLITCGVQGIEEESEQNRALLDVAGYNDGGGACFIYERDHKNRPEQLFIATEAPHTNHTRGFYRTQTWWRDRNQPRIEIPNLTEKELFFDQDISFCSSYDNCGVRTSARDSWALSEKYDFLCGEFRWTGFDYLGECGRRGYPSRIYSFGVIDSANFKKDHFYLYQSMWTEEPMVHMLPHWTHPNMPLGTEIPVWIYTNCEEAELFCNQKSLGKKQRGTDKYLEWLVPYEPGELYVRAGQDGKVAAEQTMRTAGIPKDISVKVRDIAGDTSVAEAVFSVVDEKGTEVSYADCLTGIYIQDCEILGSDNGNPIDVSPMKSVNRRAFNGLGMYVLGNVCTTSSLCIAGIFGKRYFQDETEITLSAQRLFMENKSWKTETSCKDQKLQIRYTLDGSIPNRNSCLYTSPIKIQETTQVAISVWMDNREIIVLKDVFFKGCPEPVCDLAHLNYSPDSEKTVGPFAKEVAGIWESQGFLYQFTAEGKVERLLEDTKQDVGYWWYDFPQDEFEAGEYAGTGEIWFLTGEKCKISLTEQENGKLVMDNSSGAMFLFGKKDEIVFARTKLKA